MATPFCALFLVLIKFITGYNVCIFFDVHTTVLVLI